MSQVVGPRLIVALDYPEARAACAMAEQLDPARCRLKVGKELFTAAGPQLVQDLMRLGFDVFLDLKFHDIPNTVAQACHAAARLGVWMMNVHALGGARMMREARQAVHAHQPSPLLLAVTVLTSHGQDDLPEIGLMHALPDHVLQLAHLAQTQGLDGVVCSAEEAATLRARLGPDFVLVCPGIRMPEHASHDQQRVMTPSAALAAGASYLVMGRPITQSVNPLASLDAVHADISRALEVQA